MYYYYSIKIAPILKFYFFGYLGAFCCFFVAELPLTCAKLKSIPLKRARGPLNDKYVGKPI
jgi:hypothetical protein